MTADEYVPSDEDMESRYVLHSLSLFDFLPEERETCTKALGAEFRRGLARVRRDAAREALDGLAAAEHRIARLEAQTAIRGRAVVMYRERAREAEARVKAVRAIHRDLYESMSGVPYCDECDRAWPCPTIRALEG